MTTITLHLRRFNMWPLSKGNFNHKIEIDLRFNRSAMQWHKDMDESEATNANTYVHYYFPRINRYNSPTKGFVIRWGRGFLGIHN
jgi:hypothetical protein